MAMLSTLITVLDGYPRAAEAVVYEVFPGLTSRRIPGFRLYDLAMITFCLAALVIITLFMQSFSTFLDVTAAITFLTGPVLAYLNHRVICSEEVPIYMRPGLLIRCWSWMGMVVMVVFAITYFYLRFTH